MLKKIPSRLVAFLMVSVLGYFEYNIIRYIVDVTTAKLPDLTLFEIIIAILGIPLGGIVAALMIFAALIVIYGD